MLTIKLVRHGESEANTGKVSSLDVGDHAIPLSERGRAQAVEAGRTIGRDFLARALVYTSPYRRTRETLGSILDGANASSAELRIYEDPRLREVEHGYDEVAAQEELRKRHGWFYYRYRGGESPADCYDRTSNFLETLMPQRRAVRRARQPGQLRDRDDRRAHRARVAAVLVGELGGRGPRDAELSGHSCSTTISTAA
jgi:broad specificity phosphatase PhoE